MEALVIHTHTDGPVMIVELEGDFDPRGREGAREKLRSLVEQGYTRLVIDVEKLDIVASEAITFLLDAAQRARALGGEAVVSHPSRLLDRSLAVLRLDDYLVRFETEEDAIRYLRHDPRSSRVRRT